jgi:hypothetical protein
MLRLFRIQVFGFRPVYNVLGRHLKYRRKQSGNLRSRIFLPDIELLCRYRLYFDTQGKPARRRIASS